MPDLADLGQIIARINSEADAKRFLTIVLSPNERKTISDRWRVFRLLETGMTQKKISEVVGVSPTTVGRAVRALHDHRDDYERLLVLGGTDHGE